MFVNDTVIGFYKPDVLKKKKKVINVLIPCLRVLLKQLTGWSGREHLGANGSLGHFLLQGFVKATWLLDRLPVYLLRRGTARGQRSCRSPRSPSRLRRAPSHLKRDVA